MAKSKKDDESSKSRRKSSSNERVRGSPVSTQESTSDDNSAHSSLQKSPLLGISVAKSPSHKSPPVDLPDLSLVQTSVSPALRQSQPPSSSPPRQDTAQGRRQRLKNLIPLPSTLRKLRSAKNQPHDESGGSEQEELVKETVETVPESPKNYMSETFPKSPGQLVKDAIEESRKRSVFEMAKSPEPPKQNPFENPFQVPKTPTERTVPRVGGWTPINPRVPPISQPILDPEAQKALNDGLKETIERWKATPPRKPMNYKPMGFGPPKSEENKPSDSPKELCQNTTRCLNSSYDSDKTVIDHLKRAQKRLRDDYEQFEEEIEESIEVQGIDDRQHKRMRRIRSRLRDQFEDLERDLNNFENKKRNDHKRVLEYLGTDPKPPQK